MSRGAKGREFLTGTGANYRVCVVGGGPAGSTLGTLLARGGVKVALFDEGKRQEQMVGESLIPAVVPILRRLGVEEEVAEVGLYKPGVSFLFGEEEGIHFNFAPIARRLPTYAYNVPRPEFDAVLMRRAVQEGVGRVRARAELERVECGRKAGGAEVRLSEKSLAAAEEVLGGRQPDLIVDASGRTRTVARLLEIPARVGPRKDVAYFGHYEGFNAAKPAGQVVIGRMKSGWSWRIPLRERLSVGIVMNREEAAKLGATPEERLDRAIREDFDLAKARGAGRRVSSVAAYANYQLASERGHGRGWVLAGDAYGFVDPMLSSGMFIAMKSGEMAADVILETVRGRPEGRAAPDFSGYCAAMDRLLRAWREFIDHWYSGVVFTLHRSGMAQLRAHDNALTRALHRHVERHLACMASGASTASHYSRGLMKFLVRHGLGGRNPESLCIH